jgi:hypothetical protein
MITKRKYKYTMPIKWYDCRTSLRGKKVHTVYGQQYACTSKKCKSIHCIRFQTSRDANIRLVNYYYSKPDYFIVLRLENIPFALDCLKTKHLLECFKKQLKDDSDSNAFEFKYEFLIEFHDYNYPHFHMMIKNHGNNGRQEIQAQFKGFLQEVWNASICKFKREEEEDDDDEIGKLDGVFGSVYCEKVISISGSAIYLSKGRKHIYKYNPVPEEWDTTKCHIVSRSRRFLVKEKADLLKIYNQNKQFFWEWKSDPLKDKQDDGILLAMGSDIKDPAVESDINDTPVVSDFNDEPTACEAKEPTTEDSFKEESVEYAFKDEPITIAANDCIINKPSSRSRVSKVLLKAVWGFALVGSLVFVVSKIQSLPEKPHYSVDLKLDQNKRAKFMLRWFLDNGFEYHKNE